MCLVSNSRKLFLLHEINKGADHPALMSHHTCMGHGATKNPYFATFEQQRHKKACTENPAHPRSLFSAFVIRPLRCTITILVRAKRKVSTF